MSEQTNPQFLETGERLNIIFRIYSENQKIIQALDQKAYGLLIVLGIIFYFAGTFPREINQILASGEDLMSKFMLVLLLLFFGSSILTFISVFLTIIPRPLLTPARTADQGISLIYFDKIAEISPADYKLIFSEVDYDELLEDISEQVVKVSLIAAAKQRQLKRAAFFFTFTFPAWLLTTTYFFFALA